MLLNLLFMTCNPLPSLPSLRILLSTNMYICLFKDQKDKEEWEEFQKAKLKELRKITSAKKVKIPGESQLYGFLVWLTQGDIIQPFLKRLIAKYGYKFFARLMSPTTFGESTEVDCGFGKTVNQGVGGLVQKGEEYGTIEQVLVKGKKFRVKWDKTQASEEITVKPLPAKKEDKKADEIYPFKREKRIYVASCDRTENHLYYKLRKKMGKILPSGATPEDCSKLYVRSLSSGNYVPCAWVPMEGLKYSKESWEFTKKKIQYDTATRVKKREMYENWKRRAAYPIRLACEKEDTVDCKWQIGTATNFPHQTEPPNRKTLQDELRGPFEVLDSTGKPLEGKNKYFDADVVRKWGRCVARPLNKCQLPSDGGGGGGDGYGDRSGRTSLFAIYNESDSSPPRTHSGIYAHTHTRSLDHSLTHHQNQLIVP